MTRKFKLLCLGIGLTAFVGLAILGFAIWVFLPLLPAAIIYVIALLTLGRERTRKEEEEVADEHKTDLPKAA